MKKEKQVYWLERIFFSIDCNRELTTLRVREKRRGIASFNISQDMRHNPFAIV